MSETMKDCKCGTVKLYDDGWHCMECYRPFVPEQKQYPKFDKFIEIINEEFDAYITQITGQGTE